MTKRQANVHLFAERDLIFNWGSLKVSCYHNRGSGTADTDTLCLLGSVLLSCFQQVALACSMNDTDSAMMSMILLKLPGTGFRS